MWRRNGDAASTIEASHDLQTRDAHLNLAPGAESAATIPATHTRARYDNAEKPLPQKPRKSADLPGVGVGRDSVENEKVGAGGFEPPKA